MPAKSTAASQSSTHKVSQGTQDHLCHLLARKKKMENEEAVDKKGVQAAFGDTGREGGTLTQNHRRAGREL